MNKIKTIKVSENFMKVIRESGFEFDNIEESDYLINKEKANEILKTFGFSENDNVEINDFFQFSKYFGFDKERYLLFKPLKDNAEVAWEDIRNIKYGDIDFQNHTISFPNQKVKPNRKRELGR